MGTGIAQDSGSGTGQSHPLPVCQDRTHGEFPGNGRPTELQQPTDPVWDELSEGRVAVLDARGVAASGGGFISCQWRFHRGQGQQELISGCSGKQGWLYSPCRGRHRGSCGCSSCFPTSCLCSPGLQPEPTPCSPPRDPASITAHSSPAAAAPRAPGWLGSSGCWHRHWWPHVLHGSPDTTSHLGLEAVTAVGSPGHRMEHPTPGLRDRNHLELLLGEHPAAPWGCPWGGSMLELVLTWS